MNEATVRERRRGLYFPIVGTYLFALAIIGFSDNLFTDIGQPSNSQPRFLIHGFFALAWFALIAIQPWLVTTGNVATHRKLGVFGAIAATGLVLTTAYLQTLHFIRNDGLAGIALINSIMATAFALCVALAIANRHRPELHKRLMMVGTFLILEPLAARVSGHLGLSPMATVPLIWLGLFVSLIVRDRMVLGRFTKLPWTGLAFLIAVLVLIPIGPG